MISVYHQFTQYLSRRFSAGTSMWTVVVLVLLASVAASPSQAQTLFKTRVSPHSTVGGFFGHAVRVLPDLTADGKQDLIITALRESGRIDGRFRSSVGRAYVWSGDENSLIRAIPDEPGAIGRSIVSLPDVSGDGIPDIATSAGGLTVYSGINGDELYRIQESQGQYGRALASAGDIDGDGGGDLIIGADKERDGDMLGAGRVYVFDGKDQFVLHSLRSPNSEMHGSFGRSVSGERDITGDGAPDVLVGAPWEMGRAGRLYLFNGLTGELVWAISSPSSEEDGNFGHVVQMGGDINGDAVPDLIAGAYRERNGEGRAYLISGSDGSPIRQLASPNAQPGGEFGRRVAVAGDMSGDGVPDVVVSAPSESVGGTAAAGRVYVFSGASGTVLYHLEAPEPQFAARFGDSIDTGDVAGDARPDVVVGARTGGLDVGGRVYQFVTGGLERVIYVDADAQGAGNGSSWADAYPSLRSALAMVKKSGVSRDLWIASGTYTPEGPAEGDPVDRTQTFRIPDGTRLFGGFDGTDGGGGGRREARRDQRNPDPATNGTILSGNIGTPSASDDNAYHVVTVPIGSNARIDGITIRDGVSNGTGADGRGAGLYSDGILTLSNVALTQNRAREQGGGAWIAGPLDATRVTASSNVAVNERGGGMVLAAADSVTLTRGVFQDNESGGHGAGLYDGNQGATQIWDVTFTSNVASGDGGGLFISDAGAFSRRLLNVDFVRNEGQRGGGLYAMLETDLLNLRFLGNMARDDAGGFYLENGNPGTITNAVFSGNTAEGDGGGLYTDGGAPVRVVNTTLANNEAGGFGGGILANGFEESPPVIGNTILWDNVAATDGDEIFVPTGTAGISYSVVDGGVFGGAEDQGGNILRNPCFADADGADNTVGTMDDDLRLQGPGGLACAPSPAIDAGRNRLLPNDELDLDADGDERERLSRDLAGHPRLIDVAEIPNATGDSLAVDIGAYESEGSALPVELANFQASLNGDEKVQLAWTTASETDNAEFRVQRRPEGQSTAWATVGRVKGAGTTSSSKTYRFTDEGVPFKADALAYRLQQVDTDGSTSYSEVVTVKRAPTKLTLFGTFPNPARQQTTLRYVLPSRQDITIRLYDALGRSVRTLVDGVRKGRQELIIDVSRLTSGVYFLRITTEGKTRVQKLTVVK